MGQQLIQTQLCDFVSGETFGLADPDATVDVRTDVALQSIVPLHQYSGSW